MWFFWEKVAIYWKKLLDSFGHIEEISPLSLPDKEYDFIDKISRIDFKGSFQAIDEDDLKICNSLVNHGFFIKQENSSFRPTRAGRKLLNQNKSK